MNLHTLTRSSWIILPSIQIGRWNWSKRWNFSTRWLKWAWSRSWFSVKPFFAGWQTALSMRLPKLPWFKRPLASQKKISVINVKDLQDNISIIDWSVITINSLYEAGFDVSWDAVKILGSWILEKKLSFDAWFLFSESAKKIIISSGWMMQTASI